MSVDTTRQDHGEVVAPRFDNAAAAPVAVGETPFARLDAQIGAACERARREAADLKPETSGVAAAVQATVKL